MRVVVSQVEALAACRWVCVLVPSIVWYQHSMLLVKRNPGNIDVVFVRLCQASRESVLLKAKQTQHADTKLPLLIYEVITKTWGNF